MMGGRGLTNTLAGIPTALFPRSADALALYLDELRQWNEKLHLVADARSEVLLGRHLSDSLMGLRTLDGLAAKGAARCRQPLQIFDLGSGGGFPGLVIAMARPHWDLTLIDSESRKVGFLLRVAAACDLSNVRVIKSRIEDWHPGKVADICVARALTDLGGLVALSTPLLRSGGFGVWWKGRGALEELAEANDEMKSQYVRIRERTLYRCPDETFSRQVIITQKRFAS